LLPLLLKNLMSQRYPKNLTFLKHPHRLKSQKFRWSQRYQMSLTFP
jgi:hypothetical protein